MRALRRQLDHVGGAAGEAVVLPVRPRTGGPAHQAERHPGEVGEEAARRCARSPGADKGTTAADLVEPDRHPRVQPANEAGGKASFWLGERPRPGIFGRSGLSARPPLGREVAVQVDPATVQPARRGAAVRVEAGDDKDVCVGLRAAAPQRRDASPRALVAVDAGEDEHAAAEARVAVLAKPDRASFQRPADHPAPLDQVAGEARRRGEGEEVRLCRGRRFVPVRQPADVHRQQRLCVRGDAARFRRAGIDGKVATRRVEAQLQQVGVVQPLQSRQVHSEDAPRGGVEREQEGQAHVAVIEGVGPAPVRARRPLIGSPASWRPLLLAVSGRGASPPLLVSRTHRSKSSAAS